MAFINVEVDKNLWDILDEVHKDTGINKAKQLEYLIAFRNDDKAVTKAFLYNVCASEMLEEAKSVNDKAKKLINKVKMEMFNGV